jgi:adenylate cyclase
MVSPYLGELDHTLIKHQLDKILSSAEFNGTSRSKRFLNYLVEQSINGKSEALKGYSIGIDVFDKNINFDPKIDPIVRVQAGKLRKRLELYYNRSGAEDKTRIWIPKGTYIPVIEITDNLSSHKEIEHVSAIRLDNVSLTENGDKNRIAVMPFKPLSSNSDKEYLADGITEEIINALSRFKELRVISAHSTFYYKDRRRSPMEISADLNVQYILEGSVRILGDQVRVMAQLIETDNGSHISCEVFDRNLNAENLFIIQEDIASRISAEIAEPHGVIHKNGFLRRAQTNNLDAYDCRLLASEYRRNPNSEDHSRVRNLLERAVSIDPNYSGAWAMLAMIYADEVRNGYNSQSNPPPLDRALEAAKRAIDIEPGNAVGYHALFKIHFHRAEISAFESAAEKAISLNSNYPDLLADLAACKGFLGDWDTGYQLLQRAYDLCPHPPDWYQAIKAIYLYIHNRYEDALSAADAINSSTFFWTHVIRIMTYGQLGDKKMGEQSIADLLEEVPSFKGNALNLAEIWNLRPDDMKHMIEGLEKAGLYLEN